MAGFRKFFKRLFSLSSKKTAQYYGQDEGFGGYGVGSVGPTPQPPQSVPRPEVQPLNQPQKAQPRQRHQQQPGSQVGGDFTPRDITDENLINWIRASYKINSIDEESGKKIFEPATLPDNFNRDHIGRLGQIAKDVLPPDDSYEWATEVLSPAIRRKFYANDDYLNPEVPANSTVAEPPVEDTTEDVDVSFNEIKYFLKRKDLLPENIKAEIANAGVDFDQLTSFRSNAGKTALEIMSRDENLSDLMTIVYEAAENGDSLAMGYLQNQTEVGNRQGVEMEGRGAGGPVNDEFRKEQRGAQLDTDELLEKDRRYREYAEDSMGGRLKDIGQMTDYVLNALRNDAEKIWQEEKNNNTPPKEQNVARIMNPVLLEVWLESADKAISSLVQDGKFKYDQKLGDNSELLFKATNGKSRMSVDNQGNPQITVSSGQIFDTLQDRIEKTRTIEDIEQDVLSDYASRGLSPVGAEVSPDDIMQHPKFHENFGSPEDMEEDDWEYHRNFVNRTLRAIDLFKKKPSTRNKFERDPVTKERKLIEKGKVIERPSEYLEMASGGNPAQSRKTLFQRLDSVWQTAFPYFFDSVSENKVRVDGSDEERPFYQWFPTSVRRSMLELIPVNKRISEGQLSDVAARNQGWSIGSHGLPHTESYKILRGEEITPDDIYRRNKAWDKLQTRTRHEYDPSHYPSSIYPEGPPENIMPVNPNVKVRNKTSSRLESSQRAHCIETLKKLSSMFYMLKDVNPKAATEVRLAMADVWGNLSK